VLGGTNLVFLNGCECTPNADYGAGSRQNVFARPVMLFAIITPGLIVGAISRNAGSTSRQSCIHLHGLFVVYSRLRHGVGVDGLMNGGVETAKASIRP